MKPTFLLTLLVAALSSAPVAALDFDVRVDALADASAAARVCPITCATLQWAGHWTLSSEGEGVVIKCAIQRSIDLPAAVFTGLLSEGSIAMVGAGGQAAQICQEQIRRVSWNLNWTNVWNQGNIFGFCNCTAPPILRK